MNTPLGDSHVEFCREVCGSLEIAEQREWLVTNGLGGYASGTVSGNLTRRYHGLLVAALSPPVGRTQLVAKLEETASYLGFDYARGCIAQAWTVAEVLRAWRAIAG